MAASEGGCGSNVLPRNSMAAAPNRGNSGMSQILSRKFMRSPLEQIHFVRQHGFLVAEQRDQDAQPDSGFGHRVGDYEDGEYLAVHILQVMRESDQVNVDGVENQLDRHQNDHN